VPGGQIRQDFVGKDGVDTRTSINTKGNLTDQGPKSHLPTERSSRSGHGGEFATQKVERLSDDIAQTTYKKTEPFN
jgi:hypothetical protein